MGPSKATQAPHHIDRRPSEVRLRSKSCVKDSCTISIRPAGFCGWRGCSWGVNCALSGGALGDEGLLGCHRNGCRLGLCVRVASPGAPPGCTNLVMYLMQGFYAQVGASPPYLGNNCLKQSS